MIPLVTQHWGMLRRNLAYAAITRGKRLVVVVGQSEALALADRGARARRRWAKLGEHLGGESDPAAGVGNGDTRMSFAVLPEPSGGGALIDPANSASRAAPQRVLSKHPSCARTRRGGGEERLSERVLDEGPHAPQTTSASGSNQDGLSNHGLSQARPAQLRSWRRFLT